MYSACSYSFSASVAWFTCPAVFSIWILWVNSISTLNSLAIFFKSNHNIPAIIAFSNKFQSLRNPSMETGTTFIAVLVSGCNLFLYCFFGDRTTDNFLAFGDVVYDMDFYKFDRDLQRYLTLMIASTQAPVYYHGFNILNLNLITFNAVCIILILNIHVNKSIGKGNWNFMLIFASFPVDSDGC